MTKNVIIALLVACTVITFFYAKVKTDEAERSQVVAVENQKLALAAKAEASRLMLLADQQRERAEQARMEADRQRIESERLLSKCKQR